MTVIWDLAGELLLPIDKINNDKQMPFVHRRCYKRQFILQEDISRYEGQEHRHVVGVFN
jgi:hypothetical protein